jgi:uncharacterized delta-60 repeat protein
MRRLKAALIAVISLLVAAGAYAAPGDLDPSFGGDGKVTTNFRIDAFSSEAYGVAVQSDGKIIAGGGYGSFALVRYNTDGSLDTSFGGGGRVMSLIEGGC